MQEQLKGWQTENWTELSSIPNLENEELIITNTFLNSQIRPFVHDNHIDTNKETLQPKIKWIDNSEDNKSKLITNTGIIDLLEQENIKVIVSHRQKDNIKSSILKRVLHIHPRDYNFVIKDGMSKSAKNVAAVKFPEESSLSDNLVSNSFDKSRKEFHLTFRLFQYFDSCIPKG